MAREVGMTLSARKRLEHDLETYPECGRAGRLRRAAAGANLAVMIDDPNERRGLAEMLGVPLVLRPEEQAWQDTLLGMRLLAGGPYARAAL